MKPKLHSILLLVLLLISIKQFAQHHSKLTVEVDNEKKILSVYQELTFNNQTNDTINSIVLNDWNNAYSGRETPLGKRFSDEFVRSFHLANKKEKGSTSNLTVIDENKSLLTWERPQDHPDLIEIQLKNKIAPNQKATFILSYFLKIPSDKYTKYGFNDDNFVLKNWFLTPAKYSNHEFIKYSNLNIDDNPNDLFDADIKITIPANSNITSDLKEINKEGNSYTFSDKKIVDIPIYIENKQSFALYKNNTIEVLSSLHDSKVKDIHKAIIIDKIVNYVTENLGKNDLKKITISQSDYEKNPFYGLNQLPSFISPFPDDFIFELKFLKTYLNNYLKNSLQLDTRKDNWIIDAIQIYYMMKYIDEFYPDAKMMGNIASYKLFRGFNLVSLDFNGQYSYFYMLMARKNLDQPLGDPKNTLIKFNEKIASKYRAGLSFRYLSEYIGEENLTKSINEFVSYANDNETDVNRLVKILSNNTRKDINWFFDIIINSRKIIDYKFNTVTRTKDSVSFSIKNRTNVSVPIPIYGVKKKQIVFKEWIDNVKEDSIYTFKRNDADKIVINYKNEVPEFNQRNNWKSLKKFSPFNKPIKFIFLKDLEEPFYNQIVYVPTLQYNLYDGFIAGMRFHNKTILDKPFTYDITPSYSTKSDNLSGTFSVGVNQYNRNKNLYSIRYGCSGDYFHYAQDAYYQKLNPYVVLRFRENDYRDNKRQSLLIREVYVNREKSEFVNNSFEGNYAIFNVKFNSGKNEITKFFGYGGDLQISNNFGKFTGEIAYRRLFDDNRQVSIRLYAGSFLYNTTNSKFFNYSLDRPSDYLFDYNYLGRSESAGLFSQQYIIAEGGFKSKLENPTANQWLSTVNCGFTIWNWIEMYGDIGFIKNKNTNERFVYDSGIRLNLVPDYFELYFPISSTNGWEISQPKYAEKIRFIAAFSTNTIISLFTRKWF